MESDRSPSELDWWKIEIKNKKLAEEENNRNKKQKKYTEIVKENVTNIWNKPEKKRRKKFLGQ